jgi:hypothetical protein
MASSEADVQTVRKLIRNRLGHRLPFDRRLTTGSFMLRLQTSENGGKLIAKRTEREFSLGAATVRISAIAVAGDLIPRLPQWIGYRTLAGKSP